MAATRLAAPAVRGAAEGGGWAEMAAVVGTGAWWRWASRWGGRAAAAVTAATVGVLMAAAGVVAVAVLEAVTAARRSEDLAASEEMAARVATAGSWRSTPRSAAMAAMPVLPERAALAATLLAD